MTHTGARTAANKLSEAHKVLGMGRWHGEPRRKVKGRSIEIMMLPDVLNAEDTATLGRGNTSAEDRREEEVWKAQCTTAATDDPILADTAALEGIGGTREGGIEEAFSLGKGQRKGTGVTAKAITFGRTGT